MNEMFILINHNHKELQALEPLMKIKTHNLM